MVVISLIAVTLLQGLAGTATSPLERWMHVSKVPVWWPFFLAGLTGIAGGIVLNRQMGPQVGTGEQGRVSPKSGGRDRGADAKRGKYAVPRHVRRERERERERERRRADRLADAEARERAEAEAAARAAAAENPPPPHWLGRIGGVFSRRPR